jgi:hypothetical protein
LNDARTQRKERFRWPTSATDHPPERTHFP